MFFFDQFITADVYGVFSRCFVDCGNQPFTIFDKDGEQLKEVFINHISSVRIRVCFSDNKNDSFDGIQEGIVTVAGDERHPFQDGDIVSFRELIGLENLNQCEKTIKGWRRI